MGRPVNKRERAQELAKAAVIRIGDPERNACIERLRQAYVDGEIDADKFSDRSTSALKARSDVQLRLLLWDLKEREPAPAPPPQPVASRQDVLATWRKNEGRKLELRGNRRGAAAMVGFQVAVVSIVLGVTVQAVFALGLLLSLVIMTFMTLTSNYDGEGGE